MQSKRYAIVTGGASGLGRALSVELAQHGWHVAIADVNDTGSAETLALVERAGGSGQVEHLDVTNPDAWAALAEKLEAAWPRLDLLVNNAGVGVGGEVGKLPLEDWRWIIDINLWGAIYGCHTLVGWLKANPQGAHIVNIASMAAVVSAPGMAPYNITKAGMVSLSETLHGELKPFNIGVTAVCPSFFQTNIIRNGRFQSDAQRKAAVKLMDDSTATAEPVARQIRHAIERRRLYVMVPLVAKIFWWMKRLAPRFALGLVAKRGASGMTPAEKSEYAGTP
jgi:NAD(P)-dependent dehydrogenase (short-subunit alcohol dehydrogenase family)